MKLTLQEVALLCALAEKLGWVKADLIPGMTYTEEPDPSYWVADETHGIDVKIAFQRSVLTKGARYPRYGNNPPWPVWWVRYDEWNPLESLDDAWELVEAIAPRLDPVGDGSMSLAAEFGLIFPPAIHRRSRGEAARAICLAAAKAWGISTELVR